MVKVSYSEGKLVAEGHTNQKSEQEKFVCNSVSTIMWGLTNALQWEDIEPIVEMRSGYQKVEYTGSRNVKRLFNAYANNLLGLSMEFPECIVFEKTT